MQIIFISKPFCILLVILKIMFLASIICKDIKKHVVGQHISGLFFLQGQIQFCFIKPFAFIYIYDAYWWNVQVFFNMIYYSETFYTLRVRTCYLQLWKCLFFNFFLQQLYMESQTCSIKKYSIIWYLSYI